MELDRMNIAQWFGIAHRVVVFKNSGVHERSYSYAFLRQKARRNEIRVIRGHSFSERRSLNFRHSAAMSSAFRIAETTQTRRAPARSTASKLPKLIPPIANQGISTFAAAQRT